MKSSMKKPVKKIEEPIPARLESMKSSVDELPNLSEISVDQIEISEVV